MNKREPFLTRLAAAFVMTNLLFLVIIAGTFSISHLNYKRISETNNQIATELEEMKNLFDTSSVDCSQDFLSKPSEILDSIGQKIGILETRFGKDDRRVLEQKEIYVEAEMKHYQFVNKFEENCNTDFTKIFFFYSNEGELEEESEIVGRILSSFKKTSPTRIMIYSFDFNLENEEIEKIKEEYNLTSPPISVIDSNRVVKIRNIDDLEIYIPKENQDNSDVIRLN